MKCNLDKQRLKIKFQKLAEMITKIRKVIQKSCVKNQPLLKNKYPNIGKHCKIVKVIWKIMKKK